MQLRTFMLAVLAGALAACGGDSTGPDGLTPVATLGLADLPDTLLTRQTVRLTAQATDDEGGVLPDRPLAWTSSDPNVLSITAGGLLTAVAPGTATISVATGGIVDSATVVVRALDLVHVFASTAVACGLEATGDAWCWGNIGSDGYGNGSLDSTRSLVPRRAAIGHLFRTLALSATSACGAELSGGVVCWGANDHGQLGDGTLAAHGSPVTVPGVSSIVQLAAGAAHYCARSDAGAVTCWGNNEWKQTGQKQRASVTTPHAVALGGAATDLSAGEDYTCALVASQGRCWGADSDRQLGNDTTYGRLVPVLAATSDGVARTWTDLQAVAAQTCALEVAGAMFCWGSVESGNDGFTSEWLPTRHFPSVMTVAIADGWFLRCALDGQGAVWCSSDPADAAVRVAASDAHSITVSGANPCLLNTSGDVSCQFETFPADSFAPVALPEPALRIAASTGMVCSLGDSHAVYCWPTALGLNPDPPTPIQWFTDHPASGIFTDGDDRICIIATDNTVWCRDDSPFATESVEATDGRVFGSLAVGFKHTCGLTSTGATWCWGSNESGQLGDGTTTDRATPVEVQGGHLFVQIAAGWDHTCGRTAAGEIWCWGYGSSGQIGDDHREESATPVTVDGTPSLDAISGACALSAGSAWCWDGSAGARQIAGATGLQWLASKGLIFYQRSCGLRATGELVCWGSNDGTFGTGTYGTTTTVVAAANGIRFKEVSLAEYGSACGIALDGATYCWGSGYGAVPVVMVGS
jgi:alpha-tubulin suppressor-like RCC1 family protein